MPDLQDVTSDLQIKNPQINVDIDRDKATRPGGHRGQQIENALYSAYGSRQVSTIYAPNNQYQVIMELEPQYQMDPAALSLLYIRSQRRTAGPAGCRGQAHAPGSGRWRSTIPGSSPR